MLVAVDSFGLLPFVQAENQLDRRKDLERDYCMKRDSRIMFQGLKGDVMRFDGRFGRRSLIATRNIVNDQIFFVN
jgi:hypothetical protein